MHGSPFGWHACSRRTLTCFCCPAGAVKAARGRLAPRPQLRQQPLQQQKQKYASLARSSAGGAESIPTADYEELCSGVEAPPGRLEQVMDGPDSAEAALKAAAANGNLAYDPISSGGYPPRPHLVWGLQEDLHGSSGGGLAAALAPGGRRGGTADDPFAWVPEGDTGSSEDGSRAPRMRPKTAQVRDDSGRRVFGRLLGPTGGCVLDCSTANFWLHFSMHTCMRLDRMHIGNGNPGSLQWLKAFVRVCTLQ